MPTVISVLTTSKIGIWNIPMRGQNFINNHYATINNYKISYIAQQDFLFNKPPTMLCGHMFGMITRLYAPSHGG